VIVRVLVDDTLVFREVRGDLLAVLAHGDPQGSDLVSVVQIAHAGDVVVVRVRDDQVLQPLLAVLPVGEDVVERLEDVDATARAAIDIDEHEHIARKPQQRAVALPYVEEPRLKIGQRNTVLGRLARICPASDLRQPHPCPKSRTK
jgi:hypothetical protein